MTRHGTDWPALAQATVQLAVSPKSNRVGRAFAAAMGDVIRHGSQPVPKHLRSAVGRQRHDTGDGTGYVTPHDFEGADVEQQYLPDLLHNMGRRYYVPTEQGSERRIAEIMDERHVRRASGRPRRLAQPGADPMSALADGMKANLESRKQLAETQKRDAGD